MARYPIAAVAAIVNIPLDGGRTAYNIDCPFCGKKRKFNINTEKNLFSCWSASCIANRPGSALDLYALSRKGCYYRELSEDAQFELKKEVQEHLHMPEVQRPVHSCHKSIKQFSCADDAQCSKVYTALIKCLHLSEADRKELGERGLTEQQIRQNKYRSFTLDGGIVEQLPRKFRVYAKAHTKEKWVDESILGLYLVARMKRNFKITDEDFAGVPGFYKLGDKWCVRIITGMVIPVRNLNGEIVGLCIHDRTRDAKYLSLSTRGFPSGTPAKARIHVPRASYALMRTVAYRQNPNVIVTEGILKADVACGLYGAHLPAPIVGIPGVGSMNDLPGIIQALHIQTVFNALDMDKLLKPGVYRGSDKMKAIVLANHAQYKTLYWDESGAKTKADEAASYCERYGLSRSAYSHWEKEFGRSDAAHDAGTTDLWAELYAKARALNENADAQKAIPRSFWDWPKETKGIDDELLTLKNKGGQDFFVV